MRRKNQKETSSGIICNVYKTEPETVSYYLIYNLYELKSHNACRLIVEIIFQKIL